MCFLPSQISFTLISVSVPGRKIPYLLFKFHIAFSFLVALYLWVSNYENTTWLLQLMVSSMEGKSLDCIWVPLFHACILSKSSLFVVLCTIRGWFRGKKKNKWTHLYPMLNQNWMLPRVLKHLENLFILSLLLVLSFHLFLSKMGGRGKGWNVMRKLYSAEIYVRRTSAFFYSTSIPMSHT